MKCEKYQEYLQALQEELVVAWGCTEPIAIAYAAAVAVELLNEFPKKIQVSCSGNIIKNVKSVMIPGTPHLRGIDLCAVLGTICGHPERKLEVLKDVSTEQLELATECVKKHLCAVDILHGKSNLDIIVTMTTDKHSVVVEVCGSHTNVVRMEKDGEKLPIVQAKPVDESGDVEHCFAVDEIYEFANTVLLDDVKSLLDCQINYNMAIAVEGVEGCYGAQVGKSMLESYPASVETKAIAYAAAGSDARMNGCSMPVVINSGSGNQGITVSVPVCVYAREMGYDDEKLYRALVFSNLIALHQKYQIGRLSAYCGVVSAACASGAAIHYLQGGSLEQIKNTIINTLANVSGIVCDGAKASCAAKIASSLSAALLSYHMSIDGNVFLSGDGLVKKDVEETITSFATMGRVGMQQTDIEILNLMIH